MLSWNERERFREVTAKFVSRSRFAGIIAGHCQPATQRGLRVLESPNVIALPAMKRNGGFSQRLDGTIDVHSQSAVTFLCEGESLLEFVLLHRCDCLLSPVFADPSEARIVGLNAEYF